MADLHERLLAKLDDLGGWDIGDDGIAGPVNLARDYRQTLGAVRAAVELHRLVEVDFHGGSVVWCATCQGRQCTTITAIADALGVEIGGTP